LRSGNAGSRGQALLELALVLPLTLLLGCGAVAVVQLARTQIALDTAASAAALVAARGVDAATACQDAHGELLSVLASNSQLLPANLHDDAGGTCTGLSPAVGTLPAGFGTGSFRIWFGYGAALDTFCRVGGAPNGAGVTDGDVVVVMAFRPDLRWIPLVGGWMSPTLRASSVDKIDPFRSRDPQQDPTGDYC